MMRRMSCCSLVCVFFCMLVGVCWGDTIRVGCATLVGNETQQAHQVIGALAAIKEAEDNHTLTTHIELVVEKDDSWGLQSYNITQKMHQQDHVVALLLYTYTSAEGGYEYARNANLPLIAATSALNTIYQDTARLAINVRGPFANEITLMVSFGMKSSLHCWQFGVLYYANEVVAQVVADTQAALATAGLPSALLGEMNENLTLTQSLDSLFGNVSNLPQCIFVYMDGDEVPVLIELMTYHKNYRADRMAFILPSVAALRDPFRDSDSSSLRFNNTFIVQNFPHPNGTQSIAVNNYRRALRALYSTNRTVTKHNILVDTTPDYGSLSGYIAGRFAIEVVKRMQSNSSDFTSIVYHDKMFDVDDLLLGPFVDKCVGLQTTLSPIPCFCNVGYRYQFITKINPLTGLLQSITDEYDCAVSGVAKMVVPMSLCAPSPSNLRRPFLFVQLIDDNADPFVFAEGPMFHDFFLSIIKYLNVEDKIGGDGELSVAVAINVSNADIPALHYRYNPLAYTGSSKTTQQLINMNLSIMSFVTMLPQYELEDPPLSSWKKEAIQLEPVLADYIHVLAAYLKSISAVVHIAALTEEEVALGVKSLHTHQAEYASATVFRTDADGERFAHEHLVDPNPNAWVLLITQDATIVNLLVGAALNNTNMRICLATNEYLISQAIGHYSGWRQMASRRSIVFASYLPAWWLQDAAQGAMFEILYYFLAYVLGRNITGFVPSFSQIKAFFAVMVARDVLAKTYGSNTPASWVNAFYSSTTVSASGITLGPFSSTACDAKTLKSGTRARQCQCPKGTRTFWVHALYDWATDLQTNSTVDFRFTVTSCGVNYIPLETSLNFAMIFGTIGGGVAFLIAIIVAGVIWACITPKRDNRAAPQDAKKPFMINIHRHSVEHFNVGPRAGGYGRRR